MYSGNSSAAALEGKERRAAAINRCRKRSVFSLLSSNELSCQHAVAVLQLEQFSLFSIPDIVCCQ